MSLLTTSRRRFLKTSAAAAAALSLPRLAFTQTSPAATSKIQVACIGIGNRGWYAVSELLKLPMVQIVAVCDVDETLVAETRKKASELGYPDFAQVPLFKDYREMFAKMGDRIDAVTVSTPDHHHYPATMMALQRRKHVYVEKPLTHTVGEARALRLEAKKAGVITQMGNQGRATEGIRLIREWTQAGVLGDVRNVVAWSPEFPELYYRRPKSLLVAAEKPPATLDWDLWLGPAEKRPYNSIYAPRTWRGWWDFGCGMLGDWACHTLDGPWWALDLGSPEWVEAESGPLSSVNVPEWSEVTYQFPARGERPPVVLKWLEGSRKKPSAPSIWDPKLPFPERGMLMLGDKNVLFSPNGRPDSPRLLPDTVMETFKRNRPAPTLPRVLGGPVKEWIDSIYGIGPTPGSNFDYSVPLTEMVLLGVVAQRTGKRIEWDSINGQITNDPTLNRYIDIVARDGWKV